MCRNIKLLFNFEPSATDDEVRDAALQYVRKISGMRAPSQVNQGGFDRAIEAIADATRELVEELATSAAPRDREQERTKARARSGRAGANASQTAEEGSTR